MSKECVLSKVLPSLEGFEQVRHISTDWNAVVYGADTLQCPVPPTALYESVLCLCRQGYGVFDVSESFGKTIRRIYTTGRLLFALPTSRKILISEKYQFSSAGIVANIFFRIDTKFRDFLEVNLGLTKLALNYVVGS